MDTIERKQTLNIVDRNIRPLWNPETALSFEKGDRSIVYFPLQQNKFIKLSCIKVLGGYTAACDATKMNSWGIFKYFDGSKDIKEICKIITDSHPEVTEEAVIEKIENLYSRGLII